MGLFGKKNDGGDGDDTNRSALFGSRSKGKSPAPSSNPYAQPPPQSGNPYAQAPQSVNPYAQAPPPAGNPYAQAPSGNPYAQAPPSGNPYAQAPSKSYAEAKKKAYGASDPHSANASQNQDGYGRGSQYGSDSKSPAFTGTMAGGGYGASKYIGQSGYGSDRYGTAGGQSQRAGGYGGLGGEKKDDDTNRNALFAGAQERVQQKQQQDGPNYGGAPPAYEDTSQGVGPGYGGSAYGGNTYNPGPKYEDRQLTAEEEEEEEVNATKQQIRFIKQGDVASTRNALRIAQQAEEVGRDTLARLGAQGEHIHNTEKNLDLAHNQNKIAEDKARELKTLNRSMWAVHVSNPFTAKSRDAARDRVVIEKHLEEREQREATRRAGYLAEKRMEQNFQKLSTTDQAAKKQKNLAERAKYQFEADSEDDEMEDEIDNNLDALSGVTGRLNALAKATGSEIEQQNKDLERIMEKGDKVDLGIASNRARLDRIR